MFFCSIDVSKIEEDSLKQEAEALKSQLETVEKLNDNLRLVVKRCTYKCFLNRKLYFIIPPCNPSKSNPLDWETQFHRQ